MAQRWTVARVVDSQTDRSTCGERTRLVTKEDGGPLSVSHLRIMDSARHYHGQTFEVYYILEGEGVMELDGEEVALSPGMLITVPPGVRHRGRGDFKTLVIACPPYSPEDQFEAPPISH